MLVLLKEKVLEILQALFMFELRESTFPGLAGQIGSELIPFHV